uniref:Protein phosphatase 1 regulatory subunit 3E isoform X2 n=1 Tax=Castor canadensis TaxID=51338 RepID=A0A8B7W0K5_CASCN|nr:protein phosphatase 1 regulatory subunit 3E isoform X2 [Castor canadensis]
MSRERPPRTDIPRNLSFIAALTERAYYRSQRPSLEEEPEEEPGEGGTRLGARSRAHGPSRGRRARSAPAGGGGVRAPRSRSPDTRKRVRFADALGLELAAVRRFRPGELPRVPRHVQVQLQRDALRHFAPCQPRARSLQGWRPYFLFSKSMVDPPSSLRLLLDHLLKGQVREKKQFLMLQMNKKLPGKTIVPDCAVSSHPPNLLNWLGEGKAPRAPRFVCSFQELAAVSCASVPALQDQQGTTLPAC